MGGGRGGGQNKMSQTSLVQLAKLTVQLMGRQELGEVATCCVSAPETLNTEGNDGKTGNVSDCAADPKTAGCK